ncbi:UNVERIFIED_CONTAM: hypothetical protein PYX00_011670 [Menopon gallinae]|uniref:C3H1-type domain-containing protein n=1 Tax=Menopon gallinae TaxID=328185 RepID=A0AAW2H8X6_9NEOP
MPPRRRRDGGGGVDRHRGHCVLRAGPMGKDADFESIMDILRILYNKYEPLRTAKDYSGANAYGGVAALFLSVADIFDGLAKDVDIMEGEVLFHERLCGIRRQTRIRKRRGHRRRPISFYKEKLGLDVSGKELWDMWVAEPEHVKKRFRDVADAQNSSDYQDDVNYEVDGVCRYNERCQFAHSVHELRYVERHPKHKTVVCKNFLSSRFCKYGQRCCFLHVESMQEGRVGGGRGVQRHCLRRKGDMDMEFQAIWCEDKGDSVQRVCPASRGAGGAGPLRRDRTSIGDSLGGNHALLWTKNPVFYVSTKHTKYFESSAQNMAPGEPVLPACE